MNQCEKCGRENAAESHFCRFCGTRLPFRQSASDAGDFLPPRPYSWKTDEYQTQNEPRRTSNVGNVEPYGYAPAQPLAYRGPQHLAGNYRCPNCGTNILPVTERRISTAGWVTFSLLLVFTLVFFWIGLLMKEDVSVCPVCKTKLG